jgi:hypothetical protein
LSVVPAVTVTGELTVAPFAGEQIVTEGDVGFSAHGAAAALPEFRKRNTTNCRDRRLKARVTDLSPQMDPTREEKPYMRHPQLWTHKMRFVIWRCGRGC